MTLYQQKILEYLVNNNILAKAQEEEIKSKLEASPLSFEDYILRKFKIADNILLDAKSKIAEIPSWSSEDVESIPKEVLKIVPEEAARQYEMIPIQKKSDKEIIVGMVDPTNIKTQQALRFILLRSNVEPSIVVITEKDYKKIVSLYRGLKVEVKSALEEIEQSLSESSKKSGTEEVGSIEQMEETPVTKIVAVILKHAIEGNASDIHIEPLRAHTRVRFRVDGVLYSSLILPSTVHGSIIARIKILSSLRLDEARIPQDGRFPTQIGGKVIDFRVSTFPTSSGEKVVMRVLDSSSVILEFQELGLAGPNRRKIEEAIEEPFGMMLVSGPTGSGKTTTLYTALTKINQEGVNVVSLEDPVEYHIEGVSQSQIRPEIEYTFASGLRHILRQDPDVIMVGEVRDTETAQLAIQASLTGHLVFTTIHTNNAVGVIPRMMDLGVSDFLLPSSITIAMAQRLVGKLCSNCKYETEPHPRLLKIIEGELSSMPPGALEEFNIPKPYKVWEAKGCPKCNNKKTKGRMGIYEVLQMTPELKRIILEEEANTLAIEKEAKRQGMITMKQDGVLKVVQGTISMEELLRVVEDTL